jgi:hypothetical protein
LARQLFHSQTAIVPEKTFTGLRNKSKLAFGNFIFIWGARDYNFAEGVTQIKLPFHVPSPDRKLYSKFFLQALSAVEYIDRSWPFIRPEHAIFVAIIREPSALRSGTRRVAIAFDEQLRCPYLSAAAAPINWPSLVTISLKDLKSCLAQSQLRLGQEVIAALTTPFASDAIERGGLLVRTLGYSFVGLLSASHCR